MHFYYSATFTAVNSVLHETVHPTGRIPAAGAGSPANDIPVTVGVRGQARSCNKYLVISFTTVK
jgi:hypothetical protein